MSINIIPSPLPRVDGRDAAATLPCKATAGPKTGLLTEVVNGPLLYSRITEFGRRLDAGVRRAGYAPMRLDLSYDVGFAASVVPLGVSLTRRGDA